MERYETPEMELIELESEDTIMASVNGTGDDSEWTLPVIPFE